MNWNKPFLRFDPVTAIVSLSLTAAATGHQLVEADRAKREAKRAGRRRSAELKRAAEAEMERSRRLQAVQRARFGAAGVSSNFGSPVLLQLRSLSDSILEQQRIIRGAAEAEREARARGRAIWGEAVGSAIGQLANAAGGISIPTSSSPGPSTAPGSGDAFGMPGTRDPFSPPPPGQAY